MSLRVLWAPEALADLEELISFVATQMGPEEARRSASRILSRTSTLGTHPKRCRIVPELKALGVTDYRELILAPYRVFFRLTEQGVGIIGLIDGRRDVGEILLRRYLRPPS